MKILILSTPFCGAEIIAHAIADELNHKIIIDPVDPRPVKYYIPDDNGIGSGDNGYWVNWPTEPKQVNGIWNSKFNPQTIPADTITKHNCWFHDKLPGNKTEEEYIEELISKHDRVFCIGTGQDDFITKKWIAYLNFEPEAKADNYYWEYWRRRQVPPYEDSMWDTTNKTPIVNSISWLRQYAQDNSILYVKGEDIFEYKSLDSFNSIIRSIGVGLTEHNKTQNHLSTFHNLTRFGDLGPKY